jgi:hypothetical protein
MRLFNVSMQRSKDIDYPDPMKSVSCLPNGTVVANSSGSGIQLLSLEGGHAPSKRPTISALTVHAFDQGGILSIFPTSRDYIALLEPKTMSQLLKIPARGTRSLAPTRHTTILCASHKNLMAVYYFKEGKRGLLQLWRFREDVPRWTVQVSGVQKIGRISPTAARLVTIHPGGRLSRVFVWNARNGQLEAHIDRSLFCPLEIEFISDVKFALRHASGGVSFTVLPSGALRLGLITGWSQGKRDLDVDDTHEWVVSGSKKICWVPPGYIGSIQPSYCWVGHSLVMAGQDGTLRKLTFREPF